MLNHHVTRYSVTSMIQPLEIQFIKMSVKSLLLCYGCEVGSRFNWKISQSKNSVSLSGGRVRDGIFI